MDSEILIPVSEEDKFFNDVLKNGWCVKEIENFYIKWENHQKKYEYIAVIDIKSDEQICVLTVSFNHPKHNFENDSDTDDNRQSIPNELIVLQYSIVKNISQNIAMTFMRLIYEWLDSETCNYISKIKKIPISDEYHHKYLLPIMKKSFSNLVQRKDIGFFENLLSIFNKN